ncbi:putative serine/threonine-protein kinase [Acanthamoeba polyphaga mimivirus]|nr:putative serine/threonine-protein kinase [Mimivirus reunion]WMV61619.1 putative serine/threonine-protein kinase [Mimivirus sp.]WMV62596.1 putative serine/threonine-protein kinase [Acanthamoeba polyphaga mimivirus]WMV63573.1 putative serine/threonine-protein kinase [Mimivirus sp.]
MVCFSKYSGITLDMRLILIDWLIEVHYEYECIIDTLCLAIILVDEFVDRIDKIDRKYFQCIGICCMNIATKILEPEHIGSENCNFISASQYTTDVIISYEKNILQTLDFHLVRKTILDSLWNKIKDFSRQKKNMGIFFTIVSMTSDKYKCFPCEKIADGIIKLVDLIDNYPIDSIDYTDEINTDTIMRYLWSQLTICTNKKLDGYTDLIKNLEIDFEFMKKLTSDIILKPKIVLFPSKNLELYTPLRHCFQYNTEDISNITVVKNLGEGTYGTVDLVTLNASKAAIKTQKELNEEISPDMVNEIVFLRIMDHPNIIKLYGYHLGSQTKLVLEPMESSLRRFIIDDTWNNLNKTLGITNNIFSDNQKIFYIKQLLEGLKYLHENRIVHGDLTCSNILISKSKLKICDFGSSKIIHPKNKLNYKTSKCSLWYRAIELLLEQNYDEKIDVWSVACICGFILGDKLFDGDNESEIIENIFSHLGTPDPIIFESKTSINIPTKKYKFVGFEKLEEKYPDITSIIYRMLSYDSKMRISASQTLEEFNKFNSD